MAVSDGKRGMGRPGEGECGIMAGKYRGPPVVILRVRHDGGGAGANGYMCSILIKSIAGEVYVMPSRRGLSKSVMMQTAKAWSRALDIEVVADES